MFYNEEAAHERLLAELVTHVPRKMNILVVRLGAMGDVIHTLPAVASLKQIPGARIIWAIDPKWSGLLAANPNVDELIPLDRRDWRSVRAAWGRLRMGRFAEAVDFQGLMKSALVARAATSKVYGYAAPRERFATVFYSQVVSPRSAHIVDQHLALAVTAGAPKALKEFALPPGCPEGDLPADGFVLASPLAGWRSKEWPLEYYSRIAARIPLVVNGAPSAEAEMRSIAGAHVHLSGIEGLIDATRRASAVIGVDSGPLHLAAALGKPGVAIFGPTDPARNGPYGGTIRVLRAADAGTSYKRGNEISAAMRAVTPEQVLEALG